MFGKKVLCVVIGVATMICGNCKAASEEILSLHEDAIKFASFASVHGDDSEEVFRFIQKRESSQDWVSTLGRKIYWFDTVNQNLVGSLRNVEAAISEAITSLLQRDRSNLELANALWNSQTVIRHGRKYLVDNPDDSVFSRIFDLLASQRNGNKRYAQRLGEEVKSVLADNGFDPSCYQ